MSNLFPPVALDLLRFLQTVVNAENPFCVDGRKKNGSSKGKGETMIALVTAIIADSGNKGFNVLSAGKIEGIIKTVLEEIPDKIKAGTMDTDNSEFYKLFEALGVKSSLNKKGINKAVFIHLLQTEKNDFNKDASLLIETIAQEREKFLKVAAKEGLASAQKRADRTTAGEIVLGEADRSAVDNKVGTQRGVLNNSIRMLIYLLYFLLGNF